MNIFVAVIVIVAFIAGIVYLKRQSSGNPSKGSKDDRNEQDS